MKRAVLLRIRSYPFSVVSKYWAVIVPGALGGVLFYAYSAPGYVGRMVRTAVDPILVPILELTRSIFGGLLG